MSSASPTESGVPTPTTDDPTSPRATAFASAVSAMVVLVATVRVVGFPWAAVDDHALVLAQQSVTAPLAAGWKALLFTPGMGHAMPVTNAWLATDFAAWGVNPAGWHASALIGVVVTAAVLPWALTEVGRLVGVRVPPWAAVIATLLALLHPATGEVAGWIAARKDVAVGLCAATALGAGARFARTGTKGARALAGAALVAALGAKSAAVGLPLVAAALAAITDVPARRRALARAAAAGAALAALATVATLLAQSRLGLLADRPTPIAKLAAIGETAIAHATLLLAPRPSVPFPYPTLDPNPSTGLAIAGVLVLAALLGKFAWLVNLLVRHVLRESHPHVAGSPPSASSLLLVALALAAYLPLSGLIGAPQMAAANRYLYLPLILAGAPIVALALSTAATRAPRLTGPLVVACLVLIGAEAVARNQALSAWSQPETVGDRMLAAHSVSPGTAAFYWSCELAGMGRVLPHFPSVDLLPPTDPADAQAALGEATTLWQNCAAVPPADLAPTTIATHDRLLDLVRQAAQLSATTPP